MRKGRVIGLRRAVDMDGDVLVPRNPDVENENDTLSYCTFWSPPKLSRQLVEHRDENDKLYVISTYCMTLSGHLQTWTKPIQC